jgi:hypothetical protein
MTLEHRDPSWQYIRQISDGIYEVTTYDGQAFLVDERGRRVDSRGFDLEDRGYDYSEPDDD